MQGQYCGTSGQPTTLVSFPVDLWAEGTTISRIILTIPVGPAPLSRGEVPCGGVYPHDLTPPKGLSPPSAGHGDTATDSHLELPQVDKTLKQLWCGNHLSPFTHSLSISTPCWRIYHLSSVDDC